MVYNYKGRGVLARMTTGRPVLVHYPKPVLSPYRSLNVSTLTTSP